VSWLVLMAFMAPPARGSHEPTASTFDQRRLAAAVEARTGFGHGQPRSKRNGVGLVSFLRLAAPFSLSSVLVLAGEIAPAARRCLLGVPDRRLFTGVGPDGCFVMAPSATYARPFSDATSGPHHSARRLRSKPSRFTDRIRRDRQRRVGRNGPRLVPDRSLVRFASPRLRAAPKRALGAR